MKINWRAMDGRLPLADTKLGNVLIDNVFALNRPVLRQYRCYYDMKLPWRCPKGT